MRRRAEKSDGSCFELVKSYFVYILGSPTGTLYIGMTNDLERRVQQHRQKINSSFTQKYNVDRLLYFEETNDVQAVLAREKQLKSWRRNKKISLIEMKNPKWVDLSEDWYD